MSKNHIYTTNGTETILKKPTVLKDITWKFQRNWPLWSQPKKAAFFKFYSKIYTVPENLDVDINNEIIGTLPSALVAIYNSIEKSKYILDFDEDWDDEGSPAYRNSTLISAIDFLINLSKTAFERLNEVISAPEIIHSSDGTIDILWENEIFHLLINIPEDSNLPATFYGDSYNDNNSIEGKFELDKINYGLMLSLICMKDDSY